MGHLKTWRCRLVQTNSVGGLLLDNSVCQSFNVQNIEHLKMLLLFARTMILKMKDQTHSILIRDTSFIGMSIRSPSSSRKSSLIRVCDVKTMLIRVIISKNFYRILIIVIFRIVIESGVINNGLCVNCKVKCAHVCE